MDYYLSASDGELSSSDGGVYGFAIDYYGDDNLQFSM